MSSTDDIREGMELYGADDQPLGVVEGVWPDHIRLARDIPRAAIGHVAGNRVYLRELLPAAGRSGDDRATATARMPGDAAMREGGTAQRAEQRGPADEVRIPVAEERLHVEKREVELGQVAVRKTVEQERVEVPVELHREEVHVRRHDVDARPAQASDALFEEGTIRVPARGEEAVVTKQAVVTGEVVIDKERTTERQQVTDTVREEQVEVNRPRGDEQASR